jgi:hypothetical protein
MVRVRSQPAARRYVSEYKLGARHNITLQAIIDDKGEWKRSDRDENVGKLINSIVGFVALQPP